MPVSPPLPPDRPDGWGHPESIGGPPDPVVADLLRWLPEFGPTYRELVVAFDDDPGGPAVFTELADFVSVHLITAASDQRLLARALAAVEAIAGEGDDVSELIAYAFLDSLSPDDRHRISPWLGPATRGLLDQLEVGGDWPPEPSDARREVDVRSRPFPPPVC
jgi:hypothetical protein